MDKKTWLQNPTWDGIWLHSGLWLIPVIGVLAIAPQTLILASALATLALWLAHRIATMFTAFCFSSYRSLVKKYHKRFVIAPLAVMIVTTGFLFVPLPLSITNRVLFLGTLFFLINTYHFAVQHFGVLTIYRIRSEQRFSAEQRNMERSRCLILGGWCVALGQILHGADVVRESLLAPLTDYSLPFYVKIAGVIFAIGIGGVMFNHESKQTPSSKGKRLYILGLAAQAALAFILPPLPFLMLWSVQHWLVSIALATHMAESDAQLEQTTESRWFSFWRKVNRRPIAVVLTLVFTSVIAAPLLLIPTKLLLGTGGLLPFIELLQTLYHQHEPLTLLLIGINFGTVFCHFIYDRAVFRFSHEDTRAISGPLLFGQQRR